MSDCLGPVVLAVEPNDHLETAAQLMLRNKIGGLPVMQGDQLLGIITESDLFRVFVQMKHDARAVRLTLHAPAGMELPDPGRLALATGVQVYEHFTHPSPSGGDLVALRVSPGHVDPFVQRLRDAGFLLIDRKDPEAGA
ncbi:MAG: CBS domain-containing protein [Planctomycetota bacterium]